MTNINNYKEKIETSNGDGTKKIEFVGCRIINNGEEFEANVIFPRVSEIEPIAFPDYSTDKKLFTLYIPE